MNILVIYPNQFAVKQAAGEDTFAAPGVKVIHTIVRTEDDLFRLSGFSFHAVIGLDHANADLVPRLKSKVRAPA